MNISLDFVLPFSQPDMVYLIRSRVAGSDQIGHIPMYVCVCVYNTHSLLNFIFWHQSMHLYHDEDVNEGKKERKSFITRQNHLFQYMCGSRFFFICCRRCVCVCVCGWPFFVKYDCIQFTHPHSCGHSFSHPFSRLLLSISTLQIFFLFIIKYLHTSSFEKPISNTHNINYMCIFTYVVGYVVVCGRVKRESAERSTKHMNIKSILYVSWIITTTTTKVYSTNMWTVLKMLIMYRHFSRTLSLCVTRLLFVLVFHHSPDRTMICVSRFFFAIRVCYTIDMRREKGKSG